MKRLCLLAACIAVLCSCTKDPVESPQQEIQTKASQGSQTVTIRLAQVGSYLQASVQLSQPFDVFTFVGFTVRNTSGGDLTVETMFRAGVTSTMSEMVPAYTQTNSYIDSESFYTDPNQSYNYNLSWNVIGFPCYHETGGGGTWPPLDPDPDPEPGGGSDSSFRSTYPPL